MRGFFENLQWLLSGYWVAIEWLLSGYWNSTYECHANQDWRVNLNRQRSNDLASCSELTRRPFTLESKRLACRRRTIYTYQYTCSWIHVHFTDKRKVTTVEGQNLAPLYVWSLQSRLAAGSPLVPPALILIAHRSSSWQPDFFFWPVAPWKISHQY